MKTTRQHKYGALLLAALISLALPAMLEAQFACATTNGAATITRYMGYGQSVVIPTNINGCVVTSIGYEAFSDSYNLTNVVIPDSVTSIGEYAFEECSKLAQAVIGNSLTNIASDAFYDCTSLASIMVSADNPSYSSVGGILFNSNQTALIIYPGGLAGSYTIPDGVTSIGEGAFGGCIKLAGVTIPGSVNNIADWAFNEFLAGNSPF